MNRAGKQEVPGKRRGQAHVLSNKPVGVADPTLLCILYVPFINFQNNSEALPRELLRGLRLRIIVLPKHDCKQGNILEA